VLAVLDAIALIIYTQNQNNATLNRMISEAFTDKGKATDQAMRELFSSTMQQKLTTINDTAQKVLSMVATSDTLHLTNGTMVRRMENLRKEMANALTRLLWQFGRPAVLMEDYSTLSTYVQQIHQNPDVVFVVYLDVDKEPLARHIDASNP
jgi:hypothetical protein